LVNVSDLLCDLGSGLVNDSDLQYDFGSRLVNDSDLQCGFECPLANVSGLHFYLLLLRAQRRGRHPRSFQIERDLHGELSQAVDEEQRRTSQSVSNMRIDTSLIVIGLLTSAFGMGVAKIEIAKEKTMKAKRVYILLMIRCGDLEGVRRCWKIKEPKKRWDARSRRKSWVANVVSSLKSSSGTC
jgi:hypothetical protein